MGAFYTRQDIANNIANGNVIDADDLDAEFNQIEAAFNGSTGHSHDGTTGEGGPIVVLGPAQDFLGTVSALHPKTNNTYDLGTAIYKWKDLFVDGTANLDALVTPAADINGGSIDGTVIGGVVAAAGTFTVATATTVNATVVDTTNLEVTAIKAKDGSAAATIADVTGIITIPSSVLTTADINGGTIDGVSIGSVVRGSGAFTTITSSGTVNFTGATVSNGGSVTTIDINGGTIDGTTIGAITPSNGTFTSVNTGPLTVTGTFTLGGTVITATATEINKIDGFTGTFEDLNYAATLRATGVTGTQYSYLLGVTSNIQTQLNAKANSASPVLGSVITITGGSANWTVTASGTTLTFAYNGVNRMRLDSSGNLTVTGNVTGFGTIV